MLKLNSRDMDVDADKYEEILNSHSYIYIDRSIFNAELDALDLLVNSNYLLAHSVMNATSNNKYVAVSDDSVMDFLVNYCYVPQYKFKSGKNKRGFTVDLNKVVRPLFEEGVSKDFLEPYISHRSGKSIRGIISGIVNSCSNSETYEGNQNNTVRKVNSHVNREKNLRFYYSDKSIVSIPKSFNRGICERKGKVLCWGDFCQSDFRIAYNLFLRSPENIGIMLRYEDKYEAMARILYKELNMEFDLENFKLTRHKFKVNILGPIYGKVRAEDHTAQGFVDTFNKYLDKCPRYVEFRNRVKRREKSGLPISIKGYFGHTEVVSRKYKSVDTVNDALNRPLQLGTSQVVIFVTLVILSMFRELGYSEDEVNVYFVRHDEPIFTLTESAMKDSWIFKECSRLFIDNWSPLDLEFHFGYSYDVIDDKLEDTFIKSCISNSDKIHEYEYNYDPNIEETYMPLEDVKEFGMHVEYIDGKFICSVVDSEGRGSCVIRSGYENTQESVYQLCDDVLSNISENMDDSNCIICYTNCKSGVSFVNGSFVNYSNEMSNLLFSARDFCIYMCYRYGEKYSISYTNSLPRDQVVIQANKIFERGETPYVKQN